MAVTTHLLREKRKSSFFEAVFDPTDEESFPVDNWEFSASKIRSHVTLKADDFFVAFTAKKEVISAVNFEKCDFLGDFCASKASFKKCRFDMCDFGLTSWRRARFKGCKFHRCSFSLASFEYCEFRDCEFSEISFSGNETILTNSLVNNPEAFIYSG